MAKRKRDLEEDGRDHSATSKKVKEDQNSVSIKSGNQDLQGGHLPTAYGSTALRNDLPLNLKDEAAIARRSKKLERRKRKREQQAAQQAQEGERNDIAVLSKSAALQTSENHKQRREQQDPQRFPDKRQKDNQVTVRLEKPQKPKNQKQKHGKHHIRQDIEDLGWKVSDPVGGRLLDLDPIFSLDEGNLLLAYEAVVIVYATATSLPVRHIRMKTGDKISAFAISSSKQHELYVSTASGTIEKWDWTQGQRIGHWKLSSAIYTLKTSTQTTVEADRDLVYTVDGKNAGSPLLSAHRLTDGNDSSKTEVKTLLKHGQALSSVKILEGGRFILATSGVQLIMGYTNSPNPVALQDLSYTWRIVECPEYIVSIDARTSHPEIERKKSKGGRRKIESLDVAVGGLKGAIHIYENLLGNLVRREQPTNNESLENIVSRRLHWHRNGVAALKWSLDGNYLISGGEETVLVLWQLETGRKQDLPHLGAPIESIVVSPFGSSYGVRLADNSAMILSTTELRPTFSVAGVQLPAAQKGRGIDVPFVPTVSAPLPTFRPARRFNIPACTSSLHPGSLLLAVPPSIPSKQVLSAPYNRSYLQNFDLRTSQQISRQALTRTKVTTLDMGPESNIIEEPNVTHIQTSTDGRWLATVDEWIPPKRDLTFLTFNQEHLAEEQISRQEIHLKFWSWKDDTRVWELVSRVDNPHSSWSGNPYEQGDILDLASDPSSVGFATIGADGTVKTWKPAIRHRQGLKVQSKDGQSLTSWHCKHVVTLAKSELATECRHQVAKLVYSHDGSVMVGAFESVAASPVYIVDSYSGELQSIQTGLFDGPLLGLGLVDKYLITLSHELCVLDLVTDDVIYGIDLRSYGLSLDKQRVVSHLAVDVQQGLFAVAVPEIVQTSNNLTELRSQIAIFDPADATPVFLTAVPSTITTLLSIAGRKGFVTIDSAAEVTILSPSQSAQLIPIASSKPQKEPPRGIGDIFGVNQNAAALEDGASQRVGLLETKFKNVTHATHVPAEDTVVVSQDKLAEVFDVGPAYALPPVTDLFEQVASLFNGRVRL